MKNSEDVTMAMYVNGGMSDLNAALLTKNYDVAGYANCNSNKMTKNDYFVTGHVDTGLLLNEISYGRQYKNNDDMTKEYAEEW